MSDVSARHARYLGSLKGPGGLREKAMNSAGAIRILIVDDHDLFRTGLRALLEDEGFEVADAVSGPAAVRRVASLAPDVVVMDMNMPDMDGVEATPLVLEAAPQASVLMLTIATRDDRVV